MKQRYFWLGIVLVTLIPATLAFGEADTPFPASGEKSVKSINALFFGNSYTRRHDLSQVVKAFAESGVKGLEFTPTTVIYGGRVMADHWEYRSQNWIRAMELSVDEQRKTRDEFAALAKADPEHRFYRMVIDHHERLLGLIESGDLKKWDLVVLQSWRDTDGFMDSRYAEYVPRLATLAHKQGARVLLYETAAGIQNSAPLPEPPDAEVGNASARFLAQLSKETGALVVPMTFVANRCQRARPDLPLRYVHDGHLNQTMAYLTACSFYAVLFDKSPVGLSVNVVSDNRIADRKNPENDPDGNPRRVVFDDETRRFLQKTAWEGVQEYRAMAKETEVRQ